MMTATLGVGGELVDIVVQAFVNGVHGQLFLA